MTTYIVISGRFGEPAYERTVHNVDTVTVIPQFRTVQFHDADGELIAAFHEVQHVYRKVDEQPATCETCGVVADAVRRISALPERRES